MSTTAAKLNEEVLNPMKQRFVGKDEIIDLLGVSLVAGENLFILGPPGTAKSALVQDVATRIEGRVFDYLLTRFTEPNELFGPFDIRKLREGELITNTQGMLPEAELVFLDELLNANSAILNSLLMVLNERVFRRGRESKNLPLLMVVGASNRLPEDEALGALFDRFLLRVLCDNVESELLRDVLDAGWLIEQKQEIAGSDLSIEDLRKLQRAVAKVDLAKIRTAFVELVHRLRHAGIQISDRRAVKLQRPIAASALLCGRDYAIQSDLWIMRYIWDTREQQELLAEIVNDVIKKRDDDESHHARSTFMNSPNPEAIARELSNIGKRLKGDSIQEHDKIYLRDRVSLLASRTQWVSNDQQRAALEKRVSKLWDALGIQD